MSERAEFHRNRSRRSPLNATHWSRASMAKAMGISPSSVGRKWADAGLKPHLTRGFKVLNDRMFGQKVIEIVGPYLDPPERAVVLCVDDLENAIYVYLVKHNTTSEPFGWSQTAEDILTRERRALAALDEIRGNR